MDTQQQVSAVKPNLPLLFKSNSSFGSLSTNLYTQLYQTTFDIKFNDKTFYELHLEWASPENFSKTFGI